MSQGSGSAYLAKLSQLQVERVTKRRVDAALACRARLVVLIGAARVDDIDREGVVFGLSRRAG